MTEQSQQKDKVLLDNCSKEGSPLQYAPDLTNPVVYDETDDMRRKNFT